MEKPDLHNILSNARARNLAMIDRAVSDCIPYILCECRLVSAAGLCRTPAFKFSDLSPLSQLSFSIRETAMKIHAEQRQENYGGGSRFISEKDALAEALEKEVIRQALDTLGLRLRREKLTLEIVDIGNPLQTLLNVSF